MSTIDASMSPPPSESKPGPQRGAGTRGTFDKALSLPELIAIFRRRLRLFLVVAIAVTAASLVATFVIPKEYTSTANVKIDPSNRSLVETQQQGSDDLIASTIVDTELQVAQSWKVAANVVDRLQLVRDPEFNTALKPKLINLNLGPPDTPASLRQSTIEAVQQSLDVKRDSLTFVVDFNFTSQDPVKAAQIANAFAQEYIAESVRLRMQAVQAQADALQGGVGQLADQAHRADAAAAAYRAQNGLVDAMGQATAVQQQASSLAQSLSGAEADLATAESALSQAETQLRNGGIGSVYAVLQSPVIMDLRHQLADAGKDQADIVSKYGPKHPEYIRSQQQMESLNRRISEEGERIIAGLRANEKSAQARVAAIRASLGQVQGQLAASNRAEAVAQGLDKDAQAQRDVYTDYVKAQQSANQQKNMDAPQAAIVSPGVVPLKPSFPNKPLFALLGAFLGMILGTGTIFVAETMDSGMINSRDVEAALGQPVMASVPLLSPRVLRVDGKSLSPDNYVMAKPMSAFAEAFRSIRSALVLSNVDRATKVVAFTSALPAEGKTAAAIAFARVLGMGGSRVALVDCDLRRSSIARLLHGEVKHGLVEVLTGTASLESAMVKDAVDGVWLLPVAKASFTPRDLFGSDAIRRLLAELSARFDFVVLDTPPVLAVTDSRVLATLADAVVFAVRWGKTPRSAAASAMALLDRDGAPVAGVALTMVDLSAKAALSDADPTYYYDNYRRYYEG